MSIVRNLKKSYGDFSLEIPEMEFLDQGTTALWGPSGAGKTSILRILCGLEEAENWSWNFQGQDLALKKAGDRNLGVVFQSYDLFPHLTAKENILFAAEARKISKSESASRLNVLSERLQIKNILERNVELLSGGEKQRVALSRALMGKPQFLILDEPFSALDQAIKIEARELLKSVLKESQIPALLVTHDEEDLRILSDKVCKIEKGRLV